MVPFSFLFVLQVLHGKERLPDGDPAVIRWNEAVPEDAEAVGFQCLLCQTQQKGVLKNAAGQSSCRAAGHRTRFLAGGGDGGGKSAMKGKCENIASLLFASFLQ